MKSRRGFKFKSAAKDKNLVNPKGSEVFVLVRGKIWGEL
jgi:hypothetical protein